MTLHTRTKQRFDVILCTYVLNVLPPDQQDQVLVDLANLLKPDGVAFVSVRRDVRAGCAGRTWQYPVRLMAPSMYRDKTVEIYAMGSQGALLIPDRLPKVAPLRPGATAMKRTALSTPARLVQQAGLLKGDVLDYGCGHGYDADTLGLWSWDPIHRPQLRRPPRGA